MRSPAVQKTARRLLNHLLFQRKFVKKTVADPYWDKIVPPLPISFNPFEMDYQRYVWGLCLVCNPLKGEVEEKASLLMRVYGRRRHGHLTKEELRKVLAKHGGMEKQRFKIKWPDIKRSYREYDVDRDGYLSFPEFVNLLETEDIIPSPHLGKISQDLQSIDEELELAFEDSVLTPDIVIDRRGFRISRAWEKGGRKRKKNLKVILGQLEVQKQKQRMDKKIGTKGGNTTNRKKSKRR